MTEKRFIQHHRTHHGHKPLEDEDGSIIADGAMGRIGEDNVYLRAYAEWPEDDSRRPGDLAVGEHIPGVMFRLSGTAGIYDIYRVQ
jgi:hypothetical protein